MEQSSHAFDAPIIRERFERDGWALVPRFLTPREVETLRSASDERATKGAHLLTDAEIDGARYQVQTASGRRGERAIAAGALRKITFASSASEEVALLRNDRRGPEAHGVGRRDLAALDRRSDQPEGAEGRHWLSLAPGRGVRRLAAA